MTREATKTTAACSAGQPKSLNLIERVAVQISQCFFLATIKYQRLITSGNFPTYVRSYPCRPMLKHRVFLPPSLTSDRHPAKRYPLFIEIHGGGFVIGHPCSDDHLCGWLANSCTAIVVSLDYRKSPNVQYPTPQEDCVASVKAILADSRLPIDYDRIAIGGMSAGGNLALSTAHNSELRGVFKGMLLWYPVTDWSTPVRRKVEVRTPGFDPLVRPWRFLESAYIPFGLDLKDPGLSPFFAPVDGFPKKAFFIAAADDFLFYDSYIMAKKLAGDELDWSERQDHLNDWVANDVYFAVARGQVHGFNLNSYKGVKESVRRRVMDELYDKIQRWLSQDVYMLVSATTS